MKTLLVIAVCLVLSGCASPLMWTKTDGTEAEFDADKTRCVYEAHLATASYSSGVVGRGNAIAQGFIEGIEIGVRQNQLAILCMQSKGYRQVPTDQILR